MEVSDNWDGFGVKREEGGQMRYRIRGKRRRFAAVLRKRRDICDLIVDFK